MTLLSNSLTPSNTTVRRFHPGKRLWTSSFDRLPHSTKSAVVGRTYVAVRSGDPRILGYYALASGAVAFAQLPKSLAKKLPRHPVPVVLLGRFALDLTMQGKGLGRKLLFDALSRVLELSQSLGVYAVAVDALDDEAKHFYERFGFLPLEGTERHLVLPLASIAAAAKK